MRKARQLDFDSIFDESPAASVDDWIGIKKPRLKRKPRVAQPLINGYVEIARSLSKSGEWDTASPARYSELLVGLYIVCHEKVYTVYPTELNPEIFAVAVGAARKMLYDQFDGKVFDAVQFMRWLWTREIGKERWRKENAVEARRIDWRSQFSGAYFITDYRIHLARNRTDGIG